MSVVRHSVSLDLLSLEYKMYVVECKMIMYLSFIYYNRVYLEKNYLKIAL